MFRHTPKRAESETHAKLARVSLRVTHPHIQHRVSIQLGLLTYCGLAPSAENDQNAQKKGARLT